MKNKQHVQLPNSMTENKLIAPQDLLVYASIKRFMNKETRTAFPSLDTISKVSGASVPTVRKCIENLINAEYIKLEKKGRQNIYYFTTYKNFEPFSYDFLDKDDLSFTEKAYIMASQQYMFKDPEIHNGKISYSDKEMSNKINMSPSTISRCNKSLSQKDYLQIIKTSNKDSETGLATSEKIFMLNELEQAIIFTLQDHENKINKHESEIESLKKDVKLLQSALSNKEYLQKRLNELEQYSKKILL